ncbi:hypothetical protein HPSH169_04495 [Helicobacter pylori Shi169]|uniref:Phage-Barnase-EndoU-ColicinE5/D-RelE like nuclease 3 domain-containing protein n=1 Tax=Helicobacter pylori Shi169 TaxID=1163741 RepID=A0A0E0WBA5_HELPX|nr:hypothetical protein HPSH169_04495 [Helicobacter pylori Shi169]
MGGIDFVWGNKDYGLEHILQRREGQAIAKGLNEAEAKEYALNVVKSIPEIIEKGIKVDNNGRIAIEYQNIRVGLKDNWKGEKLPNHWVITSYEKLENSESLYSSPLITKSEHLLLNSNEPNPTTNALKTQDLSPLELANAEKLAKLESEKWIKEVVSKKSAEQTKKGIKRDYSDTDLSANQTKALLNNAKIPTSGRDAVIFGKNNLTPEIVEFLHKNNKKMIIEKAYNKELELLKDANFKHPEAVRSSLDHEAITHILKRHGVNSVNVRNGESPITYQDIANYRSFIDGADDIFVDNNHLIAFKQINGYAVVVEQAVNRKSELVLKTMYKSNGDYKDNNTYKKLQDTKPSKGQP